MRTIFTLFPLLTLLTLACATAPTPPPSLPDLGPAPDIQGQTWLNVEAPLSADDLRGKVVLLHMWTFGCTNCRNTIPAIAGFYEEYRPAGFIVIGNHFPEFAYEAEHANLKKAVRELDIAYPVVEDNAGSNWQAYGTRFWPTLYLIDKKGRIRYTHIGEGAYPETENAIRALLSEPDAQERRLE